MARVGQYIVVYDISSDKERGKVDKVLAGWGFRVQYSVYECLLSRRDLRILGEQLDRLSLVTGHVRVYRLSSRHKARIVGVVDKPSPDEGAAFIV